MKVIAINLAILILLSVVASAVVWVMDEDRKASFDTAEEAVAAGVVGDNALIPSYILPREARDIVTQVNIDTNHRWVALSFGDDAPRISQDCRPIAKVPHENRGAPRWWRRSVQNLRGDIRVFECIDRGELEGYWLEDICVLAVGSTSLVWGCNRQNQIAKFSGAQQSVQPDRREDAAPG